MTNLKLALSLILISSLFSSCEEVTPVCETNSTGTLTVKNTKSTSIQLTVSGTSKTISAGSTGTFENVPSATCKGDMTYSGTKYILTFAKCVFQCETTALEY